MTGLAIVIPTLNEERTIVAVVTILENGDRSHAGMRIAAFAPSNRREMRVHIAIKRRSEATVPSFDEDDRAIICPIDTALASIGQHRLLRDQRIRKRTSIFRSTREERLRQTTTYRL